MKILPHSKNSPWMSGVGLGCVETLCRKCRSVAVWSGGVEEPFIVVEGVDRGQTTLFPECLEDWIDEDIMLQRRERRNGPRKDSCAAQI
jgi:hypothetical protein